MNERNQVQVNTYLQMDKHPHIFVAGDITAVHEEKTAQSAGIAGETVADNIKALEQGKGLEEYRWGPKPMLISLGKKKGIFTYKTFTWVGRIPAFLKDFVEWRTMLRYK